MYYQVLGLVLVMYATVAVTRRSDLRCKDRVKLLIPAYDTFYSNFDCWLVGYPSIPHILLAGTVLLWFMICTSELLITTMNRVIIFYGIRLASIATTQGYVSYRYWLNKCEYDYNRCNMGISDLTISGHSGLSWLLVCSLIQYGECWQKNIAAWLGVLQMYANLAVGDHYTSDLLISWALAVLIHTNAYV